MGGKNNSYISSNLMHSSWRRVETVQDFCTLTLKNRIINPINGCPSLGITIKLKNPNASGNNGSKKYKTHLENFSSDMMICLENTKAIAVKSKIKNIGNTAFITN
jgi:hypothetical protein